MKYLYLQDLIQDKQVKIFKVRTEDNAADILTKCLSGETTERLSAMLNVYRMDESQSL